MHNQSIIILILNYMDNKRERFGLLKEMYQRKFYDEDKCKGVLDKVINFQKKIHQFKIAKTQTAKNGQIGSRIFLEEENNQFRPSTNYTSNRPTRQKYVHSIENKKIEGPATSELRLILNRHPNGEFNILTENLKDRNLYSVNQQRKKWKILSHRQSSYRQQVQHQSKYAKVDMSNFYQDKVVASSQRKVTPMIYRKIEKLSIKQNQEDPNRKSKSLSKKVFIGGRDLEKAAEQYNKYYQEANKHIKNYEKQQKKNNDKALLSHRRSLQRKHLLKRSPKKQKHIFTNPKIKNNTKTQPKNNKYEDLILNLELDPWNVVEMDYL